MNIGQFRRTQQQSYITSLTATPGTVLVESPTSSEIVFKDICGDLSGANVMNSQHSYYLKFGVRRLAAYDQTFQLKIKNASNLDTNEQVIESYTVKKGNIADVVYFEVVISPNAEYNQIVWTLQRIADDYNIVNYDGTYGRVMDVSITSYAQIIDIMDYLKSQYSGLKYLTSIGIQGPTGLLMCINGEQIRVGRSGVYEIDNEMPITSIGFVPKEISVNTLEYFLMDFVY